MYTQRFEKMATEQSSFSDPSSQYTQTTAPPPPTETKKALQSTQTTVSLDPNGKTAELVVLSSQQKVVDPQNTEDKAVQTSTSMEGAMGGAMKGALTSRPERDSQAQKALGKIADTKLPSPNFKAHSGATPTHIPSTRIKSQTSNEGLRFSSVAEEEKRKKEGLLAKLRVIDSIKNPPESQPIESTTVRGSQFAGIGNHDSLESQAKSLTGSETQSSQHADSALPVASGHTPNIDPTTFGSPPKNTVQRSDNKSGIQNLLLGESQPFQPLKNSYHGTGNSPQSSFATAEAARTSVDSKLTENTPNVETTRSYSLQQGSLFNLNSRNLTKASTDLSSLMNGDDQTHVDSNTTTVAADLTKTRSPHAQPPVKKKPLPSFMSTSVSNGRRANPMKNKETPSIPPNRTPSNSSLQSWPDTVHNLHSGKPAYSTETDPFGSRHIAVLSQKPPPVDKSSHGSEHREHKPLHGRRASSIFTDTPPARNDTPMLPKHLESVSENHPGSTANQKTANFKPREHDSYPWEIAIDVEADELLNSESPSRSRKNHNSASKKSLLPLRPKQNENGFGMMPGASFEADDLEEVVI